MCQKTLAIDEMFRDQKVFTNIAGTRTDDWEIAQDSHFEKKDDL